MDITPVLLFIFYQVFIVLCSAEDETDKWTPQLAELKTMIAALDAKVSAIDAKVAGVQFIEHAFKVNNVDRHLRNIDTRLDKLTSQFDSIKDASQACKTSSNLERRGGSETNDNEILEKIKDYGDKCLITNVEILQAVEKQVPAMETLEEMYRSGFSKLYQKMEKVLEMEGQMTVLSQSLNTLSPKFADVLEHLSDITDELKSIKTAVTRNEKLHNASAQLSNPNKRGGSADPLNDALETSNNMNVQMVLLQEHSEKLSTAVKEVKEIEIQLSGNLPEPKSAALRNLVFFLSEAEKNFDFMFNSFSNNFKALHQLLIDVSKLHSNQTLAQCRQQNKHSTNGPRNNEQHSHTPKTSDTPKTSPPEGTLGCTTGFADSLVNIKKSTEGMNIPDKLRYISNMVSSVQRTVIRECQCTVVQTTPKPSSFFDD